MKRARWMIPAVVVIGFVWFVAGCDSAEKDGPGAMAGSGEMAPPFGGADDVKRAQRLWRDIRGYENWASYPELAGWQDGKSPHGKFLKYYINSTAVRKPPNPRNGYVIVTENYGERGGPLMAVTVMQKVRNYDPDNADWFWVKYMPDGTLAKNPKGMLLAGRVAKGMPAGCIACHGNAAVPLSTIRERISRRVFGDDRLVDETRTAHGSASRNRPDHVGRATGRDHFLRR